MTTMVVRFLLAYGVSCLLTEVGPNVTRFVMPGELYPVSIRDRALDLGRGREVRRLHRGVFVFTGA